MAVQRLKIPGCRALKGALFLALLFHFPGCREKSEKKEIVFSMEISPALHAFLTDLNSQSYEEKDFSALFTALKNHSDPYCSALHTKSPFDPVVAGALIRNSQMDRFRSEFYPKTLGSILSGCWNFFSMNDITPDNDFRLVRALYPDTDFYCYSVGFLQPYIMHSILGCRNLTMIDIDWRIHEGHRQMMSLYREGKFQSAGDFTRDLSMIHVSWVAYDTAPAPDRPLTLDGACFLSQSELCRNSLLGFSKTFKGLESVKYYISFLHEANFPRIEGRPMKVIFLSNAIEDIYTSHDEFYAMLDRVYNSLSRGQKALFIYHSGGMPTFGLYEMENNGTDKIVRTVCRDPYVTKSHTQEMHEHESYFEPMSVESEKKSCFHLLEEKKIPISRFALPASAIPASPTSPAPPAGSSQEQIQ